MVFSFSQLANTSSIQLHFKSLYVCFPALISFSVIILCRQPSSVWVVFSDCRRLHLTLFLSKEREAKSSSLWLSHPDLDVYFMFPTKKNTSLASPAAGLTSLQAAFPWIYKKRENIWQSIGQWALNSSIK